MKDVDASQEMLHLKALAYGVSGTGKTVLGVTAPDPLIAVTETQAIPIIKAAAQRRGKPVPKILLLENAEDLRCFWRSLVAPWGGKDGFTVTDQAGGIIVRYPGWWPKTIVADSMTDMAKLLADEIQRMGKQGKVDSDGMPVRKDPFGNLLKDRFDVFVRGLRDAPCHVLYLAEREDRDLKVDGDVVGTETGPKFPIRDLAKRVTHASNLVCVCFRRAKTKAKPEDAQQFEWGVMTAGPENMITKPFRPLRDIEAPNFTAWVNAFTKGESSKEELSTEGAAS